MSALYEKFVKPNKDNIFYESDLAVYKKFKAHNDTLVFHDGTDNEMIFVPIEVMDRFKCVILSREDFDAIDRDASGLSNEQLSRISQKIGETMVEEYFWESLEFWADELNLPYLSTNDDE